MNGPPSTFRGGNGSRLRAHVSSRRCAISSIRPLILTSPGSLNFQGSRRGLGRAFTVGFRRRGTPRSGGTLLSSDQRPRSNTRPRLPSRAPPRTRDAAAKPCACSKATGAPREPAWCGGSPALDVAPARARPRQYARGHRGVYEARLYTRVVEPGPGLPFPVCPGRNRGPVGSRLPDVRGRERSKATEVRRNAPQPQERRLFGDAPTLAGLA